MIHSMDGLIPYKDRLLMTYLESHPYVLSKYAKRECGFSFHGSPEYLEKTLYAHPEVEFVQIQLNYDDWKTPLFVPGSCMRSCMHGIFP